MGEDYTWSHFADNVYLDSQQPDAAYHICGIIGFKLVRFVWAIHLATHFNLPRFVC
jgi:hypothetical protein